MKRIIDENGRLFGKISVIDLFVILLVIILCGAFYVKYHVLDVTNKSAQTTPVTYSVTVYGVRDFTFKSIKAGDKLYDKDNSSGNTIGTITGVSVADAKRASETLTGKIVLGNYEGAYDVTLTVKADGLVNSGRYLVNKTYELNTNSIRTFTTKYATFMATITGVQS